MIIKYIRKNFLMLMILPLVGVMMQSCKDNDPFFAASEDDSPRILNSDLQSVSDNGNMLAFSGISVDGVFHYEAVVTPADYTVVDWYFDGIQLASGKVIDQKLLAGDYVVKLVATTTKGKSTYRERSLNVAPLASDPYLAKDTKSRWFNPGKTKTINGGQLENITKLYVGGANGTGGKEATAFVNDGASLTFTVPEGLSGELNITLEDASGKKYGCGKAHVTSEEYVPTIEDVVIFEGSQDVPEWSCVDICSTAMQNLVNAGRVSAGAKLSIDLVKTGTDYGMVVIIGNDWRGILTGGKDSERGDINLEDGQTNVTVSIPQVGLDIIKTNGFYLTGHGYQIKKVTVEAKPE